MRRLGAMVFISLSLSLNTVATANMAFAQGGISGGGGNLIDPRPPRQIQNSKRIGRLIRKARKNLIPFLSQKLEDARSGTLPPALAPIYSSMFNRVPNIFSQLRLVPTHIEAQHSCVDRFGVPVDGSIQDDEKDTVCISAANIASKVQEQDVQAQSLALLLHEYSELAGASEDQAITLQRAALYELLRR